jgi:PAS fold
MNTKTFGSVQDSIGRIDDWIDGDGSQHLGWFRFNFGDDRWTWSPQVERMHGYHPGTTAPSTLLVLSHVHPDDERHVAAGLYDMRRTPHPFSSYHRIVDAHHHVHDVVMIGVPFYDSLGAPVGMQGFYLDATPATASGFDRHAARLRDLAADRRRHEGRRRRVRAATRC